MRRLLLLAGLLVLSGCAMQPRPVARASHGPALWVAEYGGARVYLFGTMHLLVVPVPWLTPALQMALADSDEVWVEADLDDRVAMRNAMARAFDPAYNLSAHLPAAEWDNVQLMLHGCGVQADKVTHMRPWAVNVSLSACGVWGASGHLGDKHLPANLTPDTYLVGTARATGKPVHGFETPAQQIAALADPPDAVQLAMLQGALDAAAKAKTMPEDQRKAQAARALQGLVDMERSWFLGDVDATAQRINAFQQSGSPEMFRAIFTVRNQRFADGISRLLAAQTHAFVAIGAGHFAGVDNVLAQLRTKGFSVTRVE
jgi:uncharacterized protein YbaP (TraB family)